MNKRDQKALLNKMIDRVDEINDMFRPDLIRLGLDPADEIRISSVLYDVTIPLREAIKEVRESL